MKSATVAAALVLLVCGCHRNQTVSKSNEPTNKQEPTAKIVACDLLTVDDVASVQQAKMTTATPSEGATGEFLTTQCYYASAEPNRSVNISVIQRQPGPGSYPDPANYWRERFVAQHGETEPGGREHREPEEEKRLELKKIEKLGEDAYWQGGPMGGALYVLKGDVFLRISVGGGTTEQEILDKSKSLAIKALTRL